MTTEERLESMVRACVEADVSELALPADFAERVIAGGRRRFLPRLSMPVMLAGLATAAALVAVPVAVQLNHPTERPRPPYYSLIPKDLTGKVQMTGLPAGMRATSAAGDGGGASDPLRETEPVNGSRVWLGAYGAGGKALVIKVFSGSIDLDGVVANTGLVPNLDATVEIGMPTGRAVAIVKRISPKMNTQWLVWEKSKGLVIYVQAHQFTRKQLISIAEGIKIND